MAFQGQQKDTKAAPRFGIRGLLKKTPQGGYIGGMASGNLHRSVPFLISTTLNHWHDRGDMNVAKYARRVWFLKKELEKFLHQKTEK